MRGAWIWAGSGVVLVAALVLASIFAEPLAKDPGDDGARALASVGNSLPASTPSSAPASPAGQRVLGTLPRAPAESRADLPTPRSPEPTVSEPPTTRTKIVLPANNDTVNNAPEDPSHNVGVSHDGPEPLLRDPCVIPLYYRGIERKKNLQPEDLKRVFVRVTVEGYTNTWHFRPEAEDEIYVDAWKTLDLTRVVKGVDGRPYVRVGALALGGAEVKDVDLVLGRQPMGGGVFGRGLVERMRLTVDWEKGLARGEGCRASTLGADSPRR